MYEFVQKKEYAPIRLEIEAIIIKVQKILKKQDSDQTFQFHLIGSGKKHLITRIKDGNNGYDFDYNLVMNSILHGNLLFVNHSSMLFSRLLMALDLIKLKIQHQ